MVPLFWLTYVTHGSLKVVQISRPKYRCLWCFKEFVGQVEGGAIDQLSW